MISRTPKLLLESPSKLRGSESPVKKLRDHALALKSPLKEVDTNAFALSPIKFQKKLDKRASPTIKKPNVNNTQLHQSRSPIKPIPLLATRDHLIKDTEMEPKSQSPFLDAKKAPESQRSRASLDSNASLNKSLQESTPLQHTPPTEKSTQFEKDAAILSSKSPEDHRETSQSSPQKFMNISDKKVHSDDDGDYDASMEDISFQAIRKSIRKSILRKSKASEELPASNENSSSFKDAQEGPQQSSLLVNQGSVETSFGSKSSNTTIKVSLKDEPKQTTASSNTSPHHRQSQGFALLPHRDPLTVKSAKKTSAETNGVKANEKVEKSPQTKLSPLIFKSSLYPTMKLHDKEEAQSNDHLDKESPPSPHIPHHESPSKSAVTKKGSKEKLIQTAKLAYSPPLENMAKQETNSPLSNLFATVGSTLRKARSKFSKDQSPEKAIADESSKVHKPRKSSSTSPKVLSVSPSKRVISTTESDMISRLTAPTEASQAKSAKRIASGITNTIADSPTKKTGSGEERSSLKFSPVKSIYGSLRFEMNKSVNASLSPKKAYGKSPSKISGKENELKEKEDPFNDNKDESRKSSGLKGTSNQPRSLTRMSLSKPQRADNGAKENAPPRKSVAKGLASMPLEPSSKGTNRFRPKSLVSDNQPLKRKTQTEEEIKTTSTAHQPYRKIGAKIVPPSMAQTKQQQDAKRRRTADQLQSVLQKRALRVSNTRHDQPTITQQTEEVSHEPSEDSKESQQHSSSQSNYHTTQTNIQKASQQQLQAPPQQPQPATRIIPQTNTKHSKYGQVPNTQTLMKTAVLQHARLNNNETSKPNPFQNGSIGKPSNLAPMTPKAATVLPEIFSESDDDEEGSVLKDWANSPELRNILLHQQNVDPDQVFGPIAPLHMEEIFKNSRLSRFRGRGSSAQWSGQDGLTIKEIENYKQKTYKK